MDTSIKIRNIFEVFQINIRIHIITHHTQKDDYEISARL